MANLLTFNESTIQKLCCPKCRAQLKLFQNDFLVCMEPTCGIKYPILEGIPVLINEANSLFSIDDYISRKDTYIKIQENKDKVRSIANTLKQLIRYIKPQIGHNFKAKKILPKFAEEVIALSPNPSVLIIGGGLVGAGIDTILHHPTIMYFESDVGFGPRTNLICDAHDLPFAENSLDGVIIQGVLSVLLDPYRCAEEIYRVLKKRGVVYAESAFVQGIAGGRYDFTRFTHLGHRRLFNKFFEIDSGATCGPGMALAWAWRSFLGSFCKSKNFRSALEAFADFTGFWLKYFDKFILDNPAALDAAASVYFLGIKSDDVLGDKELIRLYKGVIN